MPTNNQETLENIRLWDWRALQDTLRQIQEIRTYYDFPDIDIDRYEVDGKVRQMMLAVRELNVDRLPESSRNWINEKLVYTHGYGVTMNPVNGFTPEGLPDLLLGNMPVQSTIPALKVTRPEIYFGELTNTDVYVQDHAEGVQLPAGRDQQRDLLRRALAASARRIPPPPAHRARPRRPHEACRSATTSRSESRLLMRRNIRERVRTLAPFLTFDPDPYIVVTTEGRLVWMIDGFTTSDDVSLRAALPPGQPPLNYMRNSVKATDRRLRRHGRRSTCSTREDPIIAAYRAHVPDALQGRGRDAGRSARGTCAIRS